MFEGSINGVKTLLTATFVLVGMTLCAKDLFVRADGSNFNTGNAWVTAYASIQFALEQSSWADRIFIEQGAYSEYGIEIPEGRELYGGFMGNESDPSQRHIDLCPTIIKGCRKSIFINHGIVNGLDFTGGDGIDNYGKLINCAVYRNRIKSHKGVVYNEGSLINTIIYDNKAGFHGAVYNMGDIIHCTIYRNHASSLWANSGGIYNHGTVCNSICFKNFPQDITGSKEISYSCYGMALMNQEKTNMYYSPLFIQGKGKSSRWNLHLKNGSSCIKSGKKNMLPANSMDRSGMNRSYNSAVSIGAYECSNLFTTECPTFEPPIYVASTGDNTTGKTWQTAFNHIQKALSSITPDDRIRQIFVQAGTYYESDLVIPEGTFLFGGFKGDETGMDERKGEYATIINAGNSNHSKHFARGVFNMGLVDRIHITRGKAETGAGIVNCGVLSNSLIYGNHTIKRFHEVPKRGGGIFNLGLVIHCTVAGNHSIGEGGGIYNRGKVLNSICWKNQPDDIASYENGKILYSCYKASDKERLGSVGSICSDPYFYRINGKISQWDLRLKNGSPCIDSGNVSIDFFTRFDIQGNPRTGTDKTVCVGAYESPPDYTPNRNVVIVPPNQ